VRFRSHHLHCAVFAFASNFAPVVEAAEVPFAVGTNTCLFLDDHYIAEQAGLTRMWHQGKPHPDAVVAETEPWEHWICLWGSCFYDPKYQVYRMYYQSTFYPSGVPGVSFMDYVHYAESKDAIHWVKPKLGLIEFKGSKDNNILFELGGVANAFVDPLAVGTEDRMKMFCLILKPTPITEGHADYICLKSDDGIHWKFHAIPQKPGFARAEEGGYVDGWQVNWNPIKQCYNGNFRNFSTEKVGDVLSVDGKTRTRRRAIGVTWSKNLVKDWSPSVQVLKPDTLDDEQAVRLSKDPNKPDWTEQYCMPFWNYGNHYLGLVTLFSLPDGKDLNGGGDLQFCYSNDGLQWHRQPDRQTAMERSPDEPELFPNFAQFNPPLDMGNEVWIFYSENNGTHGVTPFEKSRGRIRAGVWRKDGFVSLDCARKGSLTTKPLRFEGKDLRVNFQTQPGGSVTVTALDERGRLAKGLPRRALKGGAVSQPLDWDLDPLKGQALRLRFELNKARLWSFRFAP